MMKNLHFPGLADVEEDESLDWWNRFFASVGEEQTGAPVTLPFPLSPLIHLSYSPFFDLQSPQYEGDLIEVYPQPLESRYDLQSIVKNFTLLKGKTGDQDERGTFKGNFRVISLNQQPVQMNLNTAMTKKDENGRMYAPDSFLSLIHPFILFFFFLFF